MEEYRTYTLEDLSIGKGNYGIAASAVPFDASLHTYLRITDINDDGSLNKCGLMSVDEDDADKYLLKPNDIVFARTGNSTGRSYFYDGSDGELVYAGFLIKFSLDSAKVNPRILKYYTHSKPYYDWVQSFGTGSTRGNINAKTYGNMPITLPPRDIQDKIVDVLKSLDDKIEVNRRINDNFYDAFIEVMLIWLLTSHRNDNLEQLAMALFKSWFVDFEPFKDGEFVESELGMIPKGWRVESLGNVCKCLLGGTPSRNKEDYWNGDIAWINSGEVNEFRITKPSEYITEEGLKNSATKLLPRKTTVLAITGATLGQVSLLEIDTCANQSVIGVLENDILPYEYIYPLINDRISELCSHMTGGAQQHINKNNVEGLCIIVPPSDVIERYKEKTSPIYNLIGNYCIEAKKITSLRDSLLPKLMAGEVKVNETKV